MSVNHRGASETDWSSSGRRGGKYMRQRAVANGVMVRAVREGGDRMVTGHVLVKGVIAASKARADGG